MTYSVYKPTGSNGLNPIQVPDNTSNNAFYDSTNKIGIQLVGRNMIDYGSAIAQNIVQMTSNFAGTIAPSNSIALQGQLWFNSTSSTTGTLYVRTTANTSGAFSTNWTEVLTSGNGNAATANKLATPRTIATTGDAAWSVSFDGSADVSSALTLSNSGVTAGVYGNTSLVPVITVDSKGRITNVTTAPACGAGTVTSVDLSGGTTGLTVTGGPITSSGTFTLGGVLSIPNGGTGSTNQASAANAILPVQTGNANKLLVTNGSNVSWTSSPTIAGTNFTGIPNVALNNSSVTIGSTSVSLGGTATSLAGLSTVTATTFTGSFAGSLAGNATSATNISGGAAGQIPYQTAGGSTSFTATGSVGQLLTSAGSGAPTWTTVSSVPGFAGLAAKNGYQYFPSGVIMQWGYSPTWANVTFPIAYPNNTFVVTLTPTLNQEIFVFGPLTLSGFTPGTNGNVGPFYWTAFGN